MALPPFPIVEAQSWSNYDLGGFLLGYFVAVQADDLGIPTDSISEDFAEQVRLHVLTLETTIAKNAAVEKALHKAAGGDFETAGKLLREHLTAGAVALKFVPLGVKFSQGRKPGSGGPIRKAIAKLLAKNPMLKNPDLWEAIKKKPPKGWSTEEPRYFNFEPELLGPNPETDHMSYRRFCTVCGQERKKVKAKITG